MCPQHSISIHETQCLKKFHDQQAQLPAEERKRAPARPSACGAGGASLSLEERNSLAKEAYEEQVMVRCEGCQRTFSGRDRLEKHMRGCEGAKAAAVKARIEAMNHGGTLTRESVRKKDKKHKQKSRRGDRRRDGTL